MERVESVSVRGTGWILDAVTGSRKPLIQDQIVGKKEGGLTILDRDG